MQSVREEDTLRDQLAGTTYGWDLLDCTHSVGCIGMIDKEKGERNDAENERPHKACNDQKSPANNLEVNDAWRLVVVRVHIHLQDWTEQHTQDLSLTRHGLSRRRLKGTF
jgi:hypothetical protein